MSATLIYQDISVTSALLFERRAVLNLLVLVSASSTLERPVPNAQLPLLESWMYGASFLTMSRLTSPLGRGGWLHWRVHEASAAEGVTWETNG